MFVYHTKKIEMNLSRPRVQKELAMVTSDWLKSLRTGAWRWQRRCQRRRINRRLAALVDVLEVRAAPGEVFNVHAMLAGALPSAEAVMLYTSTFSTHDVRDPVQEWDRDRQKKQLPKRWGGGTDDGLESAPRSQRSGGGDGQDPLNPLHSIGSVNQFESRADDWVHRLNASPSENLGHGLQNPFSESGGELPSHGKPSDGASSPALRSSDLTADGNGPSGRMPVDSLGGEGGGNGSSPGPLQPSPVSRETSRLTTRAAKMRIAAQSARCNSFSPWEKVAEGRMRVPFVSV
ncbi:MAG: hypothetical protein WEB58_21980 [Planctomycetaceae bacterium]